ncbi:TetR/AcrR family transcriptional regulator [Nocardioides sp. SYSU DS0651]|uniref:TetR/AcrR family transcriptional regulator n=1 Tax=Nocardioides sp. SYSU DS0651 TaxID=3415955 RepID=UPI003F4BEF99
MTSAAAGTARRTGTKGVARAAREEQIVEVAGRIFGERGFAATSVVDVAERAGISKPLIYNYFGSKEGLFERCLRDATDLLIAEIERSAQLGHVGLTRALVTLEGVFGVLEARPWAWRVTRDPTAPGTPGVAAVRASYQRRLDALAEEGVGELMTLAGDDDPLDVSAMIAVWSSVFDALVTWWSEHPDVSSAAMAERCARLFAAVLGPAVR